MGVMPVIYTLRLEIEASSSAQGNMNRSSQR